MMIIMTIVIDIVIAFETNNENYENNNNNISNNNDYDQQKVYQNRYYD